MSDVYVLDSFAVLALLGNEPGSQEVSEVFQKAQKCLAQVLMSWVNLGEVAYIVERRWGKEKVFQMLGIMEGTCIKLIEAGRELSLEAAIIKAKHPLAYADAFAVALAVRECGILITGTPEFEVLGDMVEIQWLEQRQS